MFEFLEAPDKISGFMQMDGFNPITRKRRQMSGENTHGYGKYQLITQRWLLHIKITS